MTTPNQNCTTPDRGIAQFPLMSGAEITPETDTLLMRAATAAHPQGRQITFDELTKVPGLAAGFPEGSIAINQIAGLQTALDAFSGLTSGPVTSSGGVSVIADGALTIAKTSGLQTALDAFSGLTSGPVTSSGGVSAIADDGLTIAMTSGLQAALDATVLYTAQTPSAPQQLQARENIGSEHRQRTLGEGNPNLQTLSVSGSFNEGVSPSGPLVFGSGVGPVGDYTYSDVWDLYFQPAYDSFPDQWILEGYGGYYHAVVESSASTPEGLVFDSPTNGTGTATIIQSEPLVGDHIGQWCRVETIEPNIYDWFQWNGVQWVFRYKDELGTGYHFRAGWYDSDSDGSLDAQAGLFGNVDGRFFDVNGHANNAINATNADHASSADNSSHAVNADYATYAGNSNNADNAINADNAAHATNADNAISANQANNATYATEAGMVTGLDATLANKQDKTANYGSGSVAIRVTGGGVSAQNADIGDSTTINPSNTSLLKYQTSFGGSITFAATYGSSTAVRTYTFPDKTGTVAMIDDTALISGPVTSSGGVSVIADNAIAPAKITGLATALALIGVGDTVATISTGGDYVLAVQKPQNFAALTLGTSSPSAFTVNVPMASAGASPCSINVRLVFPTGTRGSIQILDQASAVIFTETPATVPVATAYVLNVVLVWSGSAWRLQSTVVSA